MLQILPILCDILAAALVAGLVLTDRTTHSGQLAMLWLGLSALILILLSLSLRAIRWLVEGGAHRPGPALAGDAVSKAGPPSRGQVSLPSVDSGAISAKQSGRRGLISGDAEHKQLREKIAEQQQTIDDISERSRLLLENIGTGILITDLVGEIRFCSVQTSRMTGYSRNELAGKNLTRLFADATPNFMQLLSRDYPARLRCVHKSGTEYWVDLWITKILLENEPAFVVSIADTTEAVQAEKRRQELIAHITHELRSPLTAIYASLTMLSKKERLGPTDEISLIAVCSRNAQSMKFTIDEILDFSKMEAGKLTIDTTPQNIQEIVRGAVDSISSLAEAKTLKINLSAEPVTVLADARRISQVLINLLSNAIKHSPKGKSLMITARPMDDFAEVTVSDQGAGVSDADKEALFKSYTQGSDAKSIPESSSGLGLAFCKQIVHMHGGSIWISDAPGGGASFHFTIPLVR